MPQSWQHLSFKNKHLRDDNLVFHEPIHKNPQSENYTCYNR